jgi:hypothetical protein
MTYGELPSCRQVTANMKSSGQVANMMSSCQVANSRNRYSQAAPSLACCVVDIWLQFRPLCKTAAPPTPFPPCPSVNFDATMAQGCECEFGYTGMDCSTRTCRNCRPCHPCWRWCVVMLHLAVSEAFETHSALAVMPVRGLRCGACAQSVVCGWDVGVGVSCVCCGVDSGWLLHCADPLVWLLTMRTVRRAGTCRSLPSGRRSRDQGPA